MNAMPLLKDATYEDLLALPKGEYGEIHDGQFVAQTSALARHQRAAARVWNSLFGAFDDGTGGPDDPGGWMLLMDVDVRLGRSIVAPDIVGWHRDRWTHDSGVCPIDIVPDWVCEVLSPSTEGQDRLRKAVIYARAGVPYYWLVNPELRFLEVFKLVGDRYMQVAFGEADEPGRFEPFDAVPLELARWWR